MNYCPNCKQNVSPKKEVGIGTLILALMTCGISLLVIPFYSKRCPMCKTKL